MYAWDSSPGGFSFLDSTLLKAARSVSQGPEKLVRTSELVSAAVAISGASERYAFEALRLLLRFKPSLVVGVGNFGSFIDDPADPNFTEIALTRLGWTIAEWESGAERSVPLGLAIGNIRVGGSVPYFSAGGVILASEAASNSRISVDALAETIGQPLDVSECIVECADLPRFLRGHSTAVKLSPQVRTIGNSLVFSNFPDIWLPDRGDTRDDLVRFFAMAERLGIRADADDINSTFAIKINGFTNPDQLPAALRELAPIQDISMAAKLRTSWLSLIRPWLDHPEALRSRIEHLRAVGECDPA